MWLVEEWRGLGEPVPNVMTSEGFMGEEARQSIREWAAGPRNDEAQAKTVLGLVSFMVERARQDAEDWRRREWLREKHRRQRERRGAAAAEMKAIRARLGLTMAEMADLIGAGSPHVVAQYEAPNSSYALETVERVLGQYRAHEKVAGRQSESEEKSA
jgi:DNA-binding XRE family transcriptional regulator